MMASVTPVITGCLVVDISRHIDRWGLPSRDAGMRAWSVLATAPAGVSVRLNIGAMRALNCDLIRHLVDGGILNARGVHVEGTEPEGIEAVMTALRDERDLKAAA